MVFKSVLSSLVILVGLRIVYNNARDCYSVYICTHT